MRSTFFGLVACGGFLLSAIQVPAESFSPATAPANAPVNSAATGAAENERHFVVLLAHQSADNAIELSHTFAVFVRTTGAAPGQRIAETFTISWLPVSGIISAARPAEPGVNKSLAATLAWAEECGLEVTVHGPFEIQPELFQRAVRQADRLNRGELKYKAFDRFGRDTAKNCIHALSDIAEDQGRLQSGAKRGDEGTRLVVRRFEPFFVSGSSLEEAGELLVSLNLRRFAATAPTHSTAATSRQTMPSEKTSEKTL